MRKANEFFDNAKFVESPQSEDRGYVISKAVAVEKYVAMYLSFALGIPDYSKSKSFGSTSSALSFNSKVNLFLDLKIISEELKNKLILFAEIRNRFAHVEECSSFQVAYTNEISNKLKKFYPDIFKKDNSAKKLFDELFKDIKIILDKAKNDIYNSKANRFIQRYTLAIYQACIDNMKKNPEYFNNEAYNIIFRKVTKALSKQLGIEKEVFRTNIKLNLKEDGT